MAAKLNVTVEVEKFFLEEGDVNHQVSLALVHAARIVNQWQSNQQEFFTQEIFIGGKTVGYVSIDDSEVVEKFYKAFPEFKPKTKEVN